MTRTADRDRRPEPGVERMAPQGRPPHLLDRGGVLYPLRRTHHLPISARHSTVLGYPADGSGRAMWASLDWSWWFVDHLLDAPGCDYLHVRVGGPDGDGRVYRVRCRYSGGRYRGRAVESVSVGFQRGTLCWIVRT